MTLSSVGTLRCDARESTWSCLLVNQYLHFPTYSSEKVCERLFISCCYLKPDDLGLPSVWMKQSAMNPNRSDSLRGKV